MVPLFSSANACSSGRGGAMLYKSGMIVNNYFIDKRATCLVSAGRHTRRGQGLPHHDGGKRQRDRGLFPGEAGRYGRLGHDHGARDGRPCNLQGHPALRPGKKAVIVSGSSETKRVRTAQEQGSGSFVRKSYILEKIGLAVRRNWIADRHHDRQERAVFPNGQTSKLSFWRPGPKERQWWPPT